MNYVVISKKEVFDKPIKAGKAILVSFARIPLWKAFYWLNKQGDTIPNCYDMKTAKYALKKYGNEKDYEVVTYEQALGQLNEYLSRKVN